MVGQLCILEWEDAVADLSTNLDTFIKDCPAIVRTYGILVHKDKSQYVMMTHDGGADSSDFIKVPTSLVRKVIKLNLQTDKRK